VKRIVDPESMTGLILAGGQARRMQAAGAGGQHVDKALLRFAGKTLVEHAVDYLTPKVGKLLISANRNRDIYAAYGEVVADDPALGVNLGPLAGVASALAVCRTPWLAVIPVDVPVLPGDLLERLAEPIGAAEGGDGLRSSQGKAMASGLEADGASQQLSRLAYAEAEDGRAHPLCMLLHRDLSGDLRSYLQDGERKVQVWQERNRARPVVFQGGEPLFFNINTPEDLRRLEALGVSRS